MRETHGREMTNTRQELAAANTRARDIEIQFRQTERLMNSDLRGRTERAAELQDELTTKCRAGSSACCRPRRYVIDTHCESSFLKVNGIL